MNGPKHDFQIFGNFVVKFLYNLPFLGNLEIIFFCKNFDLSAVWGYFHQKREICYKGYEQLV